MDYIEKAKGLKLEGLDSCIVGLCKDDYLVYSYTKLVNHFCKEHEIMDALEYVGYNIIPMETEDTFKILYDWE